MMTKEPNPQQPTSRLFLLGLAALLVGCGSDKSSYPSARLAGAVTLDGQPIAEGNLQFVPQDTSKAPVTGAQIVDGHYVAEAVPRGKVRVLLTATKQTGKMITEYSTPRPEIVNVIPKKYRAGIPIDVTQDDSNRDFALQSR